MNQSEFRGEHFGASWSAGLWVSTLLVMLLVIGASLYAMLGIPSISPRMRVVEPLLILFILASAAFFTVRGYILCDGQLIIERAGWVTRLNLETLTQAYADSSAMKGSIRLFGCGGFFVYCGLFLNRKVGRYRAYATNPANAVVLRFGERTVVVTPDEPERFARQILEGSRGRGEVRD